MKSTREFQKQVKRIQGISIRKEYYRFVAIEYIKDSLSALYSKLKGGRYNFKESFEALYLAPAPNTAIKEGSYEAYLKFKPKAIITVEVEVQHHLKLTFNCLIIATTSRCVCCSGVFYDIKHKSVNIILRRLIHDFRPY